MSSAAFIALGSNSTLEGLSSLDLLKQAILEIHGSNLHLQAISRFFKNPAYPIGSGPNFVNAVVQVRTHEKAQNVMELLHSIEKKFGRLRLKRWGERTLDLDLLAFGQTVAPNKSVYMYWRNLDLQNQKCKIPTELILPHPRMHERAFVLIPLLDIAPYWIHPILKKNTEELCYNLSSEEISKITCI